MAFLILLFRPDVLDKIPEKSEQQITTIRTSFADAVQAAAPAVVNIYTSKSSRSATNPLLNDPLFRRFFGESDKQPSERQHSLGSGVIVSHHGYILTNNHVIAGADKIYVMLQDGRKTVASLIGTDPETDIAVLQIDLRPLPELVINGSSQHQVGDIVLAIGNPYGVGQTVTQGIISATGRNRLGINTFEDFIQTDASINPGNSGGALVNAKGELIGINTAIYSPSGTSNGIGFAITMKLARYVLDQIVRYGSVVRGWLGIEARDLDTDTAAALGMPGTEGVVIAGILVGGPAGQAGLKLGDILISIIDKPIYTSRQAINTISSLLPGQQVEMIIVREGNPIKLIAEIGRRPNYKPRL